MASPQVPEYHNPESSFPKFFKIWITEQSQYLQDLISAAATKNLPNHQDDDDHVLCDLVERVVRHYERYYHAKSLCISRESASSVLTPSWMSPLEDAFLWIGGWRPAMAFHLFYSKSGLQLLETGFPDPLSGGGDLGDISHRQLNRIDELQRRTIREEREITEEMARVQETVADSRMVELSREATEGGEGDDMVVRIKSALSEKENGLKGVMHKADDLRLRTLEGILDILTPLQCVHFLIAAAELHLRFHEWGMKEGEGAAASPPPPGLADNV